MLRPGNKTSQHRKTAQWVISFSFVLLFCGVVSIYAMTTMQSAKAMSYTLHEPGSTGVNATPNPPTLITPPPTPLSERTPTPTDGPPSDGSGSGGGGSVTPPPNNGGNGGSATPQPIKQPTHGGKPTTTSTPQPALFPGLPRTGSDPRGVALP
jgi:hypothetical protein